MAILNRMSERRSDVVQCRKTAVWWLLLERATEFAQERNEQNSVNRLAKNQAHFKTTSKPRSRDLLSKSKGSETQQNQVPTYNKARSRQQKSGVWQKSGPKRSWIPGPVDGVRTDCKIQSQQPLRIVNLQVTRSCCVIYFVCLLRFHPDIISQYLYL
jgi:hypothetical protein